MAVDLSAYFQRFLENISLGDPQVPRMNSAEQAIRAFLTSSYNLPPQNVFLQGSYANHTAVEPVEGGEYDIDLVAVCVGDGVTADAALNDLEARFRADGRYSGRIKRKKPCVRLEYAEDDVGKFHVDVVPVHITGATLPPLESPRRGEGWRGTAPAEYTAWCLAQGERYTRTVKMLKRWRGEQQTVRTAIKSIVLQVLIAQCMPQVQDDAARLAGTLRALHDNLKDRAAPPPVMNPVLPSENLAASWTQESFAAFVGELTEAAEWVEKAMTATDPVEAIDAWVELLGDDFPTMAPGSLGIALSDYSHAETPEQKGWRQQPDLRYGIKIRASVHRGKRSRTHRPHPQTGLVFAGNRLHFKAHVDAPSHADIWWQVANTGGHARDEAGLRGEIFKGKSLRGGESRDSSENWESSKYTGSHLIRAMLVRSDVVVATSDWFTVNIYSKGNRFRP